MRWKLDVEATVEGLCNTLGGLGTSQKFQVVTKELKGTKPLERLIPCCPNSSWRALKEDLFPKGAAISTQGWCRRQRFGPVWRSEPGGIRSQIPWFLGFPHHNNSTCYRLQGWIAFHVILSTPICEVQIITSILQMRRWGLNLLLNVLACKVGGRVEFELRTRACKSNGLAFALALLLPYLVQDCTFLHHSCRN